MNLNSHLLLVPRLRMSMTVASVPLYAFMAFTGTTTFKDKVVPVDTMKAYRGSRGTAPLILNLLTRYR
jgi:hypothetical protein